MIVYLHRSTLRALPRPGRERGAGVVTAQTLSLEDLKARVERFRTDLKAMDPDEIKPLISDLLYFSECMRDRLEWQKELTLKARRKYCALWAIHSPSTIQTQSVRRRLAAHTQGWDAGELWPDTCEEEPGQEP